MACEEFLKPFHAIEPPVSRQLLRVAWFTRGEAASAALIAELRARHHVRVFDARTAHAFVWQHARHPFETLVYELDDTAGSAFLWPYLLHVPGVVHLRDASLRASRGAALVAARRTRDFDEELRFSRRRMLRVPLAASTLVVLTDSAPVDAVREECPEAEIRLVPAWAADHGTPSLPPGPVIAGVYEPGMFTTARRAAERARAAGAQFELREYASAAEAAGGAHIVLAMRWPPAFGAPQGAVQALSAGRVAIVHEIAAIAGWPALDPQTWEPRGLTSRGRPIVISIDPMDEEHSLAMALRRLAADGALRAQLGASGHAWWAAHATVAAAADAWDRVLREAAGREAPPKPAGWPAHLSADGTGRARETLAEFGVSVDFLN